MLKAVIGALLRLFILSAIFLGSCVGSGSLYLHSAKWHLDAVDLERDRTFFSAYRKAASEKIEVVRYRYLPKSGEAGPVHFRMTQAEIAHAWPDGGNATVTALDQADGSQLIRIHAIGDTPWVSLSEYRVADNEIQPLRHGLSNHLYLLGVLLSPFITWFLRKPVKHLTRILIKQD